MNFKRIFAIIAVTGLTGLISGCSAENNSISMPVAPGETTGTDNNIQAVQTKYGIPQNMPDYGRQEYGIPALNVNPPEPNKNPGVKKYGIPEENKKIIKHKKRPHEDIMSRYALPDEELKKLYNGEDVNTVEKYGIPDEPPLNN